MWKKLFVLLLTFCLGFFAFQFLHSSSETTPQNIIIEPDVIVPTQPVQNDLQKPPDVVATVRECLYKFKDAVRKNDEKAVVSLINFPIEIGFTNQQGKIYYKKIRNESEFLADYSKIFDDSFKEYISELGSDRLLYRVGTPLEVFTSRSELKLSQFYINGDEKFEIKISEILKYKDYK